MPVVNGKHFSYTKKGVEAAKKAMKKKGKKMMQSSDGHMMVKEDRHM